ncbi:hypothetical protein Sjap_026648 [Stephania japonica]|uniref:ATP synthase protein MI25 n=1 Tax=Stephania japonica TaxID=461633 RepID=A0AAP0DUV0_9MAGN
MAKRNLSFKAVPVRPYSIGKTFMNGMLAHALTNQLARFDPRPSQILLRGFIIFSRKSLGKTFKVTLDGRIQAIQEESQQFPNPNEVVPPESNEQQRLLRISLRICGTVVESLPIARCAPKCEKTVQALLCRNLNVKSATLPNATLPVASVFRTI